MLTPHRKTSSLGIQPTTSLLSGQAVVLVGLMIMVVGVLIVDGCSSVKIHSTSQHKYVTYFLCKYSV